jgi:hypothetical protein
MDEINAQQVLLFCVPQRHGHPCHPQPVLDTLHHPQQPAQGRGGDNALLADDDAADLLDGYSEARLKPLGRSPSALLASVPGARPAPGGHDGGAGRAPRTARQLGWRWRRECGGKRIWLDTERWRLAHFFHKGCRATGGRYRAIRSLFMSVGHDPTPIEDNLSTLIGDNLCVLEKIRST